MTNPPVVHPVPVFNETTKYLIPQIVREPMTGLPAGEWHWIRANGASEAIRKYKAKYGRLPEVIAHFRYDRVNWYGKTNKTTAPDAPVQVT